MLSNKVIRTLRHPIKVLSVGELPGPTRSTRASFLGRRAAEEIEAAGAPPR